MRTRIKTKDWLRGLLVLVFLLVSGVGHPVSGVGRPVSGFQDSAHGTPNTEHRTRKTVFIAAPTVGFSPETRLAGGGYLLSLFRLSSPAQDSFTRPSFIDLSATYTQLRQLQVLPAWQLFTGRNRFAMSGEAAYMDYSESFFGIGNETREQDQEIYRFKMLRLENRAQARIFSKLFAGVNFQYQHMYGLRLESGGLLDTGSVSGSRGSVAVGLGPVLTWDDRNSVLTPANGFFADVSYVRFGDALGSDFAFQSYTVDVRKHIPVIILSRSRRGKLTIEEKLRHVLALQGYFTHLEGAAPFRMLARMGNSVIMRGFYAGRYRDHSLLAAQAEYRFPVYKRLGLTLFGGAGRVASSPAKFSPEDFRKNWGFGLRYLFNRKENLNIRLDYGFGFGTSGAYLTVGEAF